jgi:hypothetical protein
MFFLLPGDVEEIVVGFEDFNSSKIWDGAGVCGPINARPKRLRLAVPQNPRCRGRLRLLLRYFRVVFRREIQQPLLGEGVGMFRETPAAFCLFF